MDVKDNQNTVPSDDVQIVTFLVDYIGGSCAVVRRREVVGRRQCVVALNIDLDDRVVIIVDKYELAIW